MQSEQQKETLSAYDVLQQLIAFIEVQDVADTVGTEGNGSLYKYRSFEFDDLLDKAKQVIERGDEAKKLIYALASSAGGQIKIDKATLIDLDGEWTLETERDPTDGGIIYRASKT